jgi:ribosomal protection tetracycline resistance protein
MFTGTVHVRDRISLRGDCERKVTAIGVFERGGCVTRPEIAAGHIGKLWGLHDVQIGDAIGIARASAAQHHFAPPTLETVVTARQRSHFGALYVALAQLAEQDPLINVRQDDVRRQISVSLYGEVQKEVIGATLATEYGLDVDFRESTTICVERPVGTGTAVEVIGVAPNPFLATVGLTVAPGPENSGVVYHRTAEVHGKMPLAFFKAVEDTVHRTLEQGLEGWRVIDCVVTLTHVGYYPKRSLGHAHFHKALSSTGADFRNLTPLVLMTALARAGTQVCEPMHRFELEAPSDVLVEITSALAKLGAVAVMPVARGATYLLTGEVPAVHVHALQQQLPALTRGEGVLSCAFARYRPVRGIARRQPRTDFNPLNRKEYLLRVAKRLRP